MTSRLPFSTLFSTGDVMTQDFSGLSVALATPFTDQGDVDMAAFRRLTAHVVDGGVDVLVVLGSTGEGATVLDSERDGLIEACLEEAKGLPVVVGTGHNATRQTALLTKRAQQLGAHGALVVTPYYNKPTPNGLVAHYAAVAEAAPGMPIILYNVPGRTGLNLTPSTLSRLWENPQVVALKESTSNLRQMEEIYRALPLGKQLLCGDDDMTLPAIAAGACGLVSVMGNLIPRETKAFVDAALGADYAQARAWQSRLLPVIEALFTESNPIPLKAGLQQMGLAGDMVRLPLVPAEAGTRAKLASALAALQEVTQ
jgi:4-hydroxy-tetrahydrodipicolinate synthase